jgi:hypothetical protein
MPFAEVQLSHLLEVIWVSLVAGVFVTVTFSFVVLGSARSTEARRTGHGRVALAYAGVAVVAFVVFAAAVAFGVNVMLSKG